VFILSNYAQRFVYEKLRFCTRGFSAGKSDVAKQATNFGLAKNSNFLYTLLATVFLFNYFGQLGSNLRMTQGFSVSKIPFWKA